MNRLTAHQPLYFGWLGLYAKIAEADTFVIFDDVQYDPNDWQNRNRIRVRDGVQLLTVPVFNKGYQDGLKIKDVKINNSVPWQRKHFKSIEAAYRKAKYYERYEQFLKSIYSWHWEYLADLDTFILKWMLIELGINVRVLRASEQGFIGTKSDLVLDMCRCLKAKSYTFGAMGRDYADLKAFKAAGIEVLFQEYQHPRYYQQYLGFEPSCCVLDLLMNKGPESLGILRGQNGLVL